MSGPFVTTISLDLTDKLQSDLKEKDFTLSNPPYTVFSAKKQGVSLTLYQSGKLVVQGKKKDDFIHFYLEPEILQSLQYSYPSAHVDKTSRIGVDEAGKGDFFGPLCIGAVYADAKGIERLIEMGIKDSKTLNDKTISKLALKVREEFKHKVIIIYPQKYNELYSKFKNLNSLLAWGHATAIDHLVKDSKCTNVIIDKFANEYVVKNAVKKKSIEIDLTQVHKGESDPVVAAASILARHAFVDSLDRFETQYNFTFPKGASKKVIQAKRNFVKKFSENELPNIGKMHFKTAKE